MYSLRQDSNHVTMWLSSECSLIESCYLCSITDKINSIPHGLPNAFPHTHTTHTLESICVSVRQSREERDADETNVCSWQPQRTKHFNEREKRLETYTAPPTAVVNKSNSGSSSTQFHRSIQIELISLVDSMQFNVNYNLFSEIKGTLKVQNKKTTK